jgi:very-short-patch-repair endonuclease
MLGEKFRREYPLGLYTLDFVCIELKLNIEIDGKDHLTEEGKQRDAHRNAFLRKAQHWYLKRLGTIIPEESMEARPVLEFPFVGIGPFSHCQSLTL